jgi:hypothetical protein
VDEHDDREAVGVRCERDEAMGLHWTTEAVWLNRPPVAAFIGLIRSVHRDTQNHELIVK